MPLIALGLNHTTAPVNIREQLTFGPDIIVAALRSVCDLPSVHEAVILSTCNRTELYVNAVNSDAGEQLQQWLVDFHGLELDDISNYLYEYQETRAIAHLLAVASGLDSLILGEPQILGQIKAAYQTAQDSGYTGKLLQRLFQHAFNTAKQVRTDTAIGDSPVSVAFAAVRLARQIFSDIAKQTALLIGAGENIELAARHLHQHRVSNIIIANRTLERAHGLAEQFNAQAIGLTEISTCLSKADIVIASTASPLPILGKGAVERALKKRRHRPVFMVDIAVPRDIEPEVADLPDVYLYTVDDLQEVIKENLRSRQQAAEQAQDIIDFQVNEFLAWLRSLDAVDLIQGYRIQAENIRDEVLQKALRQIENGKSPQEAMQFLANTLTNKLLHTPSSELRQASSEGEQELLKAASRLFRLR